MPCLRHGPMERSPWIPILNVRIHYLSYSKIRMPYRILSILVPGWIQYSDMVLGICPGTRMPVQPSTLGSVREHWWKPITLIVGALRNRLLVWKPSIRSNLKKDLT